MKSKIQLVIPAAGNGERFKTAGYTQIKPLIPVFNIPMINWVIANFDSTDISKIIVVSKFRDEIHLLTKNWFKQNRIEIIYHTIEDGTDGPADTVNRVESLIDSSEPMVVANSDQFVNADLNFFLERVTSGFEDGTILTMFASGSKWSYVKKNDSGQVIRVAEKEEISNEATVGIYGWNKAVNFFDSFREMAKNGDRTNGEFYVAPTYNYLISGNKKVGTVNLGKIDDRVFGLGTPIDLEKFICHHEMMDKAKEILNKTR